MDIVDLKPILDSKLTKQLIPARILLDKFRIIEDTSRRASAYTDPKYAPFYYYLGTLIKPTNVLDVGFKLGLLSGSFLQGCKTVENFLGFQEKVEEYYSARLGRANIKSCFKGKFDFYYGNLHDEVLLDKLKINWDLILMNEERDYDYYRMGLDLVWNYLNDDGIIVMDYVLSDKHSKRAFSDFCVTKNRAPVILKTRYGTGLIKR
jgi:predicted O-methyltransferase YrrM